jgi:hypothetical protein
MWLLVMSPTLCGSPTVISKLGLAACSILTLGCVCRRKISTPVGDGWPWEEYLALEAIDLSSSPASTGSIKLLLMGDDDEAC